MTSTEEVPLIPSSIGARQAEPPAPQNWRVHVFSLGRTILQRSPMGVFLAPNEKKRLPQCPNGTMKHSHCDLLGTGIENPLGCQCGQSACLKRHFRQIVSNRQL